MINLYTKFLYSRCNLCEEKKQTANDWNFSKSKEHNSIKYFSIVPKIIFDRDISMVTLCNKFHYSGYNAVGPLGLSVDNSENLSIQATFENNIFNNCILFYSFYWELNIVPSESWDIEIHKLFLLSYWYYTTKLVIVSTW